MRYISMFSGIEAASVAFHPLGWSPICFAEIEAFPSAVLAHHYPDVPNVGDMTAHDWAQYRGQCRLLVGGPPCQAFSIAGLRKSLDDDRGNLSLAYMKAHHAIDPLWSITENVPGWLSTKDNAFGCFLAGLVGEDAELLPPGGRWTDAGVVTGPKRTAAWRILDAQYFGLAQRRRRVFVLSVRGSGEWRPAAALFPVGDSLSGNPAPSREAGKGIAPTISARTKGGGGLGTDFDLDGGLIAKCLSASHTASHTASGRQDPSAETYVTHALRADGFDASEDGTGRATPIVPVPYSIMPQNSGKDYKAREVDVAQPLMAGGPVGGNQGGDYIVQPLPFDTTQITNPNYRSNNKPGDHCHTLAAGAHPPAIAFQSSQSGVREVETHATLDANMGSRRANGAMIGSAVRRLTPRECERLQGFPDDYTLIPYRGKPAADGPRYKALGNSMAVPVMRWIGERIQLVEQSIQHQRAA